MSILFARSVHAIGVSVFRILAGQRTKFVELST